MMTNIRSGTFDPRRWKGFLAYRIRETAGIERKRGVADFAFEISHVPGEMSNHELRVALLEADGCLREVPAQFYRLRRQGSGLAGRVAFFADVEAHSSREARIYYGNPEAGPADYLRSLQARKGDLGPQHWFIENEFYKIETLPKSGQIWHVWDKLGSNTSWHHNEWDSNRDKGGDPCHWAPNCWVAYPERVTNGYEAVDPDAFDWHYVFGWDNPKTEIIDGPVFWEMRRKDVVWPHPEHSSPNLRRDRTEKIVAEVVYRFYDGCPFFVQTSDMQTLQDLLVYFIRNSQYVFLDHVFTHTIICPEATGLKATDEVEPAVLRLMAHQDLKPFPNVQHTLSNVLPSKLDYTSFIHESTGDGFAQFQMLERNTNVHSGRPTYYNHMVFLTELHNWAVYYARAFSYTNRRFHPENAVWLPKGERYEEENVCLIYRHENVESTIENLARWGRELRSPLSVTNCL